MKPRIMGDVTANLPTDRKLNRDAITQPMTGPWTEAVDVFTLRLLVGL